jgi:hypothetical protein
MSTYAIRSRPAIQSRRLSRTSAHPALISVSDKEKQDLPHDITFSSYACHYYKKAPLLAMMTSLPYVQNVIFFSFIGLFNDKSLLAGYGLCCSALLFLNLIFSRNIALAACVLNSQNVSSGNFKEFRLTFYRSINLSTL